MGEKGATPNLVGDELRIACRGALQRGLTKRLLRARSARCRSMASRSLTSCGSRVAGAARHGAFARGAGQPRCDRLLGCVIRGETYHFELVANQAAAGIMQVQLDTGVPVAFGC